MAYRLGWAYNIIGVKKLNSRMTVAESNSGLWLSRSKGVTNKKNNNDEGNNGEKSVNCQQFATHGDS